MNYDVWQTCFLFNFGLSRSECASWVQAWGSIGAIVAAAGIALWNDRRALRIRRELAIRKVRTFCAALVALAERVIEIAPTNSYEEVRSALALLDETMMDGRGIEQELLRLEWTAAVTALRSVGAQMSEYLRLVHPKELSGDWASRTAERFRFFDEKIGDVSKVIRESHPGVPIDYS